SFRRRDRRQRQDLAVFDRRAAALPLATAQWLQCALPRTAARQRRLRQAGPLFWQIGTDGGLLDRPVAIRDRNLLLAPAERADIIVDFADFKGDTLLLLNSAPAPYPSGDAPDPQSNGRVMHFPATPPLRGIDSSYEPQAGATLRGGPHQPPAIIQLTSRAGGGAIAAGVTIAKRRQLV